ncbi:MAG: hypothetical protein EOP85_15385 [Verrucomicrobiaceae bacterium]|nr:MAG: hypothetical protein EOP85_15385 [Verrucomicrobiaceae bacterium]
MGETKQAVSNALRVARDGSPALHKAIVADRISSTTADSIIKQAGTDHSAQDKLLDESLSEATRQGSSHVTPKHVAKPDPAATGFEETSTSTSDHVISPVEDDEQQPGESPAESNVKDLGTSKSPATGSNAPADPGAYQRLTSAPSTNRDGSSGRGDGYVAPDKRIKKIEKLLDDVNPDKCIDDRRISFERLAAYLNGECSIKDLRRWLEGRE